MMMNSGCGEGAASLFQFRHQKTLSFSHNWECPLCDWPLWGYLPKRALTRLPMLPNSRIGELLPHHWISADYSLSSWEGQVQTERRAKDEGDEPQAQER
jgi:hypothetical protein